LVNRLFPKEQLLNATVEKARQIADNAPLAVRQAKQSIRSGLQMSLSDALAFEIEAYNRLVSTEDRKEGVLAFNERRVPIFTGR
jgi:enoyl-CoA hydratase